MTNLFKIYLDKFRKQLLKFLLGFDLVEYLFAQEKIISVTASAVATLMMNEKTDSQIVNTTLDTVVVQQKSFEEIQKALSYIIKTLETHQSAINQLVNEDSITKKTNFLN